MVTFPFLKHQVPSQTVIISTMQNTVHVKLTCFTLFCNSTQPQHTLQMFSDHCGPKTNITWETINQGLLQPQGELSIQTIINNRSQDQLLEFRTSFSGKQLAVSSLSEGISGTINSRALELANITHQEQELYPLSLNFPAFMTLLKILINFKLVNNN